MEPERGAISRAGAVGSDAATDAQQRHLLFARIRAGRIGGTFWGIPVAPAGERVTLVAPSAAQPARSMAEGARRPTIIAAQAAGTAREQAKRTTDPWSLLAGAAEVRAHADHEIAALGAIAGVPVVLFGEGRFGNATDGVDEEAIARHLLIETAYRDPFTGASLDAWTAMEILTEWRRWLDRNRGITVATGIAWWKKKTICRFLWAPRAAPLRFANSAAQACRWARQTGGSIAAWPSRMPADLPQRAGVSGVPVAMIEDGFLRSVGLGSALHQPWSVVLDSKGIYYDPSGPSDLEAMLADTSFDASLLERATALRRLIVEQGISKYGAAAPLAGLPARVTGRRRVLVAGQVEDDLSVLRGGTAAPRGEALLAVVRRLEPESEIWFKPHPDVDAGFRRGGIDDARALRHVDRIVRGGSMAEMLGHVDAVHVLTSLTGFEALLRGLDVTVHGTPFYAGWGLTRDLGHVPERRNRRLTLDQLVAAVLILYPRYLDPATQLPCRVERVAAALASGTPPARNWITTLRGAQGRALRWRARGRRPLRQS